MRRLFSAGKHREPATMNHALGAVLLLFSSVASAGGYTVYAQPTEIEVVNNGLLIYGSFGNVMSCGYPNAVFYPATHQNYNVVSAMAMTAIVSGKTMKFYVDQCVSLSFHGINVNQAFNGSAIYFK